ncbi:MAG: hypothetical protein ACJARG_000922, partial [Arcticibacterium sp.]
MATLLPVSKRCKVISGMKIIYIKVFFGYLIVQVEAIRS